MANKWFAALLGFLIPPLAFVYLAKLRVAGLCFFLLVCAGIADFYLASKIVYPFLTLLLSFLAAIYAFVLAKKTEFEGARKWYSRWWGVLLIPVTIFSIIFLTRSFVIEPFSIPSESMSPSLEMGDYILVKKWGYGLYGSYGITLVNSKIENRTKPQKGEIFVIIPPHDSRLFVKRVIGLPGDVVEFGDDKQLIINEIPVETTSLDNGILQEVIGDNIFTVKYINDNSRRRSGKWIVPDAHYFVMGDNRDNSADSRVWGMVPDKNIVGRVLTKW